MVPPLQSGKIASFIGFANFYSLYILGKYRAVQLLWSCMILVCTVYYVSVHFVKMEQKLVFELYWVFKKFVHYVFIPAWTRVWRSCQRAVESWYPTSKGRWPRGEGTCWWIWSFWLSNAYGLSLISYFVNLTLELTIDQSVIIRFCNGIYILLIGVSMSNIHLCIYCQKYNYKNKLYILFLLHIFWRKFSQRHW